MGLWQHITETGLHWQWNTILRDFLNRHCLLLWWPAINCSSVFSLVCYVYDMYFNCLVASSPADYLFLKLVHRSLLSQIPHFNNLHTDTPFGQIMSFPLEMWVPDTQREVVVFRKDRRQWAETMEAGHGAHPIHSIVISVAQSWSSNIHSIFHCGVSSGNFILWSRRFSCDTWVSELGRVRVYTKMLFD